MEKRFEQVDAIAAALSELDGRPWRATRPDSWRAWLISEGEEILVQESKYGRLEFGGRYSDERARAIRGMEYVDITVSAERDPADIARDISRRLLPRYRELLAKYEVSYAELRGKVARNEQAARKLGLSPNSRDLNNLEHRGNIFYVGAGYAGIKLRGHDRPVVDIDISGVEPGVAAEIIALLDLRYERRK